MSCPEVSPIEELVKVKEELTGKLEVLASDAFNVPRKPKTGETDYRIVIRSIEETAHAIRIIESALREEQMSPQEVMDRVRESLLGCDLTTEIRELIGRTCPSLTILDQDIAGYHFAKGMTAIKELCLITDDEPQSANEGSGSNKVEGGKFLQRIFQQDQNELFGNLNPDVCNELDKLEEKVTKQFGQKYNGLVHLLFHCLGDFYKVNAIVTAQIHSVKNGAADYLEAIMDFINEYGYISEYLIDKSQNGDRIAAESKASLRKVLSQPVFSHVRGMNEQKPVKFYELIGNLYQDSEKKEGPTVHTPWFVGNLRYSFLDARKIKEILKLEIPPADLAKTLLAINEYAEATRKKLSGSTDEIPIQFPMSEEAFEARKIIFGLLRPKNIYKDINAQHEFLDIVRLLFDDDRLRNDKVLARSISLLLGTKDPHLELEIDFPDNKYKGKNIREILMDIIYENYDENYIRNGLDLGTGKITLFPLSDKEALDCTEEELRKNFDTARFGIERKLLTEAADALLKIEDELEMASNSTESESFRRRIAYTENQAALYYNVQQRDGMERKKSGSRFFVYQSATEAITDVVNQCFGSFRKDDAILRTDQEYASIVSAFLSKRTADESNNEPGNGSNLSGEEISISTGIGKLKSSGQLLGEVACFPGIRDKKPKVLIISTGTRWGESPCSEPGTSLNTDHLAALSRDLPKVLTINPSRKGRRSLPVVLDGSQTIGRTEAEDLSSLKPDIFLSSGFKGLGIGSSKNGSAAVIAISEHFLENLSNTGRRFIPYQSSKPLKYPTALALGLRMLRQKYDLFRIEGNLGADRELPMHKKIAKHMRSLTAHAIQKSEEHGFKVYAPTHRNKQDYFGIITVIPPEDLTEETILKLQNGSYKYKFTYEEGMIRLSFHYCHNPEDIDRFFEDVEKVRSAAGEVHGLEV